MQNEELTHIAIGHFLVWLAGCAMILLSWRRIHRTEVNRTAVEQELRTAKIAAEAANRTKSEFLANMSHEIRTPLNAVVGMSGLLLETRLTPEQTEYAETIRTSSDALLAVINDILDFSKIEAGRLDLEQQPFNLHGCVEEAIDLLTMKAGEKNLNLAYSVAETVPEMVVGDVTRLRQVLVNLLNNAVKFTSAGEVELTVQLADATEIPAPNQLVQVHFAIRDTGIGIPQDRMDRLFRPFSQVDASTTRTYGGTGLGLVICRQLVELMGGAIWVESELGVGSTFHFTVTLVGIAQHAEPDMVTKQIAQLAGMRVLIVDDDATNRRIAGLQAKSFGMHWDAVGSGWEALQVLESGAQYDVALIDMQMPRMDGAMLAQEIRRQPQCATLPLVLLTSLALPHYEAPQSLFAAQIVKPVKTGLLRTVLVQVLHPTTYDRAPLVTPTALFDAGMAKQMPLHILLVEDNAVNQKVALRMLERLGYRADVAGNGEEAIQSLQRQSFDVVLMDVQMPVLDGVSATRRIRAEFTSTEQPYIIAMTAHAMESDEQEFRAAGMDDYVTKPVVAATLVAALERAYAAQASHPVRIARLRAQPLCLCSTGVNGSVTTKRLPLPSSLSTAIDPPRSATMART
ncbi:MAG: response regulator [Anaerolineales bacterium]|nr:response regulator [Anaerolineales bacterium]